MTNDKHIFLAFLFYVMKIGFQFFFMMVDSTAIYSQYLSASRPIESEALKSVLMRVKLGLP